MTRAKNWLRIEGERAAGPAPHNADIRDARDEFPARTHSVRPNARMERHAERPQPRAAPMLDLGNKGCGDGPLEDVARALRPLPVGAALEVRTTDGDVAVALLAWCRFMGHTIADRHADRFLIISGPRRS